MGPMQEVADALVKGNFVDTWMTVDYSAAYKRGPSKVNRFPPPQLSRPRADAFFDVYFCLVAGALCVGPGFVSGEISRALYNVFNRGVNMSAQWDDVDKFRPGHTHGRSFDDSQTADIELAHYYAVDQCDAPYIAIFQTDMPLGSLVRCTLGARSVVLQRSLFGNSACAGQHRPEDHVYAARILMGRGRLVLIQGSRVSVGAGCCGGL